MLCQSTTEPVLLPIPQHWKRSSLQDGQGFSCPVKCIIEQVWQERHRSHSAVESSLPSEPPFSCCLFFFNRTSFCIEMVAMLQKCRCHTELLAAEYQKPQLLKGPQERSLKILAVMARYENKWQPCQKRTAAPRGTALIPQSSYLSGLSGESWMRMGTWRQCETNLKQVKKFSLRRSFCSSLTAFALFFYISNFSPKMASLSKPTRLKHG